ncbi:MAG: DUF819 family protein [Saprospiraceae bacterium]|nr:DUF819 family protein [Saprospiraceae bacterium]MCF8249745.1 DUF819 family protein [Saprospiraceae bacterium]MCF8279230.1 DUF819 family protein [Bacteroidales bacterium]MCF8312778.1 DUF819 family protein [Saprospiraceae bacterium]MCF8441225.1 DUF819 family protein [Saprospiraceae bacterium]
MEPIFTNDAVVFGLLCLILGGVFYTSKLPSFSKFYGIVPTLVLCYFLPALLYWPLGLIAPEWFDGGLLKLLGEKGLSLPSSGMSYGEIKDWLETQGIAKGEYGAFAHKSQLYFVASRYLLPASLLLLCLGIDLKGILKLGPKALIMFFTATLGVVIGGPVALMLITYLMPDVVGVTPDELWRGLSTIAGSWIGGGANQAAMKEIFKVNDSLFGTMVVVDVLVANIWMAALLYGASTFQKIDNWLKADNSAIKELEERVSSYRASIEKVATARHLFMLMAVAFSGVAVSHLVADMVVPALENSAEAIKAAKMESLLEPFFWIVLVSTTVGLLLSFSRARKLEGVGASTWGTLFIYVLVTSIGMKMNIGEIFDHLGLFAIGVVWMLVHCTLLIVVAKLIKAPFFFVAVGSQANIGGAASAPIVASAFSPALAPVGVLLAVMGYALGTYGAIICAMLMRGIAG